ncbi:MAG: hypothetical protein U5L08_05410 [Xanthomonadales bacterium]|nr:hypothetical protein [Xanthomonadales bacterium]
MSELPTALEVRRVVDLAGKFRGAKTMVENTVTAFVDFYRQVGQNLTPWRAPPPKYKKRSSEEERSETEVGRRSE